MGWAVKLDKEDFLGQRPLARVAEGGPLQRLVGFKMADPHLVPDEGLQIVTPGSNGRMEIIGWVTSSRFSPTLGEAIGLCWLPAEIAGNDNTPFTIRQNGRLVEGRVHHGAFYDPKGNRLRT
jgi:aminomethyltransferase